MIGWGSFCSNATVSIIDLIKIIPRESGATLEQASAAFVVSNRLQGGTVRGNRTSAEKIVLSSAGARGKMTP
ncbi:MAG: hypothetical protein KatS3mg024_0935 [Armatimonadota bacterium]|nr:MAG: hypothetical protein KatS3mg024_0935 [Armatimonadota bacterium]